MAATALDAAGSAAPAAGGEGGEGKPAAGGFSNLLDSVKVGIAVSLLDQHALINAYKPWYSTAVQRSGGRKLTPSFW